MKDFGCNKFFGSRKYEEQIDWLGSSMIASAFSGKATHKELKHAYHYTKSREMHCMHAGSHHGMQQVSTATTPGLRKPSIAREVWVLETHLQ